MAKKTTKASGRKKYPDSYRYVVLRLWHKDLDPEKISDELGIEPDDAWWRGPLLDENGNPIINKETGKPYARDYGQWNLCSTVRGNTLLVTRIRNILEQLRPKKKILRRILKEVNADLDIAVEPHKDLAIAGYTFPADVLNEITSLGIDIHFSIHIPQYCIGSATLNPQGE
ncbi:MAG: DUF4279 domain-containing protein [Phycisphaerae bacterium]|nr:DUF4279 domain-containing protein [Phycisphaerae bacterium]